MLPQASVSDVVARGGRIGSPLAVSLKKIGKLVMKLKFLRSKPCYPFVFTSDFNV